MVSQRTKAALAVKREVPKREGKRLGNPNGAAHLRGRGNVEAVTGIKAEADATAERFRKTIAALRAEGVVSAQGMARAFNEQGL